MNTTTVRPLVTNSADEHKFLTPAQAARRAGVSRPTINRALKSLALLGHRDNRNCWRIDPHDLDTWLNARRDEQHMTSGHDQSVNSQNDQLEQVRAELSEVREKLAAETARADAAETDRNRWQAMAEKLVDRPGWWARLWGR